MFQILPLSTRGIVTNVLPLRNKKPLLTARVYLPRLLLEKQKKKIKIPK
jgi:hypothetical protein